MIGMFQSDPIEKHFGLYRQTLGSNYRISELSLKQSEIKLRLSSLIDLSSSLSSINSCLDSLRKPKPISSGIRFSTTAEFLPIYNQNMRKNLKVTDPGVLYYIVGCVAKKALKGVGCSDCLKLFKSPYILSDFSHLMEKYQHCQNMFAPTSFLMSLMIYVDYTLHGLSSYRFQQRFFETNNKFDLILSLTGTQLDFNIECESGHCVEKILVSIIHSFSNVFLGRLASFLNDYISGENFRKLSIFENEYDAEDANDPVETN